MLRSFVEGWTDYGRAVVERGKEAVGFGAAGRREGREDELEDAYREIAERARSEDFRDLEDLGISTACRARSETENVLIVYGSRIPMKVLDRERVFRFFVSELERRRGGNEAGKLTVIYVHTEASYEDNCPGLVWLGSKFKSLPESALDRVSKLIILHPDWHLWSCLHVLGYSILQTLWAKTEFFLRIEYLWDLFDKGSIPLEDFVRSHDADLEHNPLSDFYINRTSLSQAANPDHM